VPKLRAAAKPRELPPGQRERVGILIDAEQSNSRTAFEDRLRVSPGPESRVDEESSVLGPEEADDLVDENGNVRRLFNVSRLPSPVFRPLPLERDAPHESSFDKSS